MEQKKQSSPLNTFCLDRRMDAGTDMDLRDDVHGLLDQLCMSFADTDSSGSNDQGTVKEHYRRRRMLRQ